ncbi:MAG: cardiolipin synthase [Flavisolibacter sp.]
MTWLLLFEITYPVIIALVCLRIIYDTRNTTKTLAYLLFVVFVPVIGILFYFSFGINYRKRKMYSKKITEDDQLAEKLKETTFKSSGEIFKKHKADLQIDRELAYMLAKDSMSSLTEDNDVKLLVNGEQKFPLVLEALENARHHIHIEYYIYEDGEIGRAIEDVLIRKAKEGVEVRFIYDDFGSRSIRRKLKDRLKEAGVKAFPFYRVHIILLANRINYRNHRKIIVIDGCVGFVGGINVSDRYINNGKKTNKYFWRDTHLRIEGSGVNYLQYLFICDWNFCANDHLYQSDKYFPPPSSNKSKGNKIVQIAASGPDSDTPTILFSILEAINLGSKEILITTPYFIPVDSIMDALIIASLGGVNVKILVPDKSDSRIVNAAAKSYYGDLLVAGVKIYRYRKGFVHAKTMVIDSKISMVGTANMDIRSFDLNFEVNAIVYDEEIANQLRVIFYKDLEDSEEINGKDWASRSIPVQLVERTARLVSPLL